MQATLKKAKTSAKFGIVFPKDVPMNYSKDLGCVEHPKRKNIWIKVTEKEINIINN